MRDFFTPKMQQIARKTCPTENQTTPENNENASPERFAPFSREDFESRFAIPRARKMSIFRNE
jgi:hypothetical protein